MKLFQFFWQIRALIFLSPLLLCISCKKSSEQTKGGEVDTVLSDAVDSKQPNQQAPVTPNLSNKTDNFAAEVGELTKKANAAEAKFDFATAIQHWEQIGEIVSKRFGDNSWQSTNVKLAIDTARKQSKFDNSQLRVLQTVAQLQAEIAKAIQKRDYNTAYQRCYQASQLTKSLFGTQSYLFARMQNQLAHIAASNRQSELALSYYETALSTLKSEMGTVHPEVEATSFAIGQIYQQMGKSDKAISYLAESVSLSRKVWGEQNLIYATRAHDLGVAYHKTKNYQQAIKFLNIARQVRVKQLGTDHPQLAHTLRNIGVVFQDKLEYTKAGYYYDAATKIFLSRLGPENPFTIDCQTKLAIVLTILKEYPRSEALLAKLAETQKKLWPTSPIYAQTLFRLATVQSYQGKYETAEPFFKQALAIQSKSLGDRHSETQKTVAAYAMLLNRTGREARAKQLKSGIRTVGHTEDE